MNKEPKFCKECGKKLIDIVLSNGFDEYTGEKNKTTTKGCPQHFVTDGYAEWIGYKIIPPKK